MFDLMSATRGAIFRALNVPAVTDIAPVYDDLPQNTQPPFLKIGSIDSDNVSSKGDQTEQLTVEVYAVYRGADRGVMMRMLHAAREAIDQQPIAADGATFGLPHFLKGSASDASPADGVTFAGIMNFEVLAEPT